MSARVSIHRCGVVRAGLVVWLLGAGVSVPALCSTGRPGATAQQWHVVTVDPARPDVVQHAQLVRAPTHWRLRVLASADGDAGTEQQWPSAPSTSAVLPWARLRQIGWPGSNVMPTTLRVAVAADIQVPVQVRRDRVPAEDVPHVCAGARYHLHGAHPAGYRLVGHGRACLHDGWPVWQSGWLALTTPEDTALVQFAWAPGGDAKDGAP